MTTVIYSMSILNRYMFCVFLFCFYLLVVVIRVTDLYIPKQKKRAVFHYNIHPILI